jgi:hypothetical protein
MPDKKKDITLTAPSEKRNARSIHIFSETFTEGEWHYFEVQKLMQITGEEKYYLLESAQGNRMLMMAEYYDSYGILPGTSIQCIVDKINCSGKMYLEPAHPYYKAGESYLFKVLGNTKFTDRKGRNITRHIVMGPHEQQGNAVIKTEQELPIGTFINAIFAGTRKGVLILKEIEVLNNC